MSNSSREIVQICLDDQRKRWQRGDQVKVENYLSQTPDISRDPDAVLDLIYHEMVLREASGEVLRLEEYLERFPKMADQLKLQFQFHQAMDDATLPKMDGHQKTLAPAPETRHGDVQVLQPGRAAAPNIPGYDLLSILGEGGMGVVYKARHLRLNRLVALKMIRGDRSRSKPEQALREMVRFRLEAEAVAQLKHSNVVQIHEFGEHEGAPFFSLELVEGGNLHQRLAGKPMPPKAAAKLTETLARAVHAAHLQGIVHRDLKPANVLLDKDGTPKITDFGLAKFVKDDSHHTRTEEIVGTPAYMAPEQADRSGKPITPAVDVYALGALMYETLTGRPPFRGDDWMQTLLMVVHDDPTPPRQLEPKIPIDLETICLKCLAKDPAQRYLSAEALAEDLRRFQAHEPILARPITLRMRFFKWMRRHPAIAAALAAALLIVVAGVVTGFWIQNERTERHKLIAKQAEADLQQTKEKADKAAQANRLVNQHVERAALYLSESKAISGGDLAKLELAKIELSYAQKIIAAGDAEPAEQLRIDELATEIEPAIAKARDAAKDRAMSRTLSALRSRGATPKSDDKQSSNSTGRADDKSYAAAFQAYGIDVDSLDEAVAAEQIKQSFIRLELVLALDNWHCVRYRLKNSETNGSLVWAEGAKRLLRIARLADDVETRNAIRDAVLADNGPALKAIAGRILARLLDNRIDLGALGGAIPVNFETHYPPTLLVCAVHLDNFKYFKEAIQLLHMACAHHPDDYRLHYQLGLFLESERPVPWDEIILHYACAMASRPDDVESCSRRGWATYARGKKDVQYDDVRDAQVLLRRALVLDPAHFNSHYRLGLCLIYDKKLPEAIKHLVRSIDLFKDGVNAYVELGRAYNLNAQYKEAVEVLLKGNRIDSTIANAWFELGYAYLELGDNDKAVEAYKACLNLKADVVAHHNLGLAYMRKKMFREAEDAFLAALKIDPNYQPSKTQLELAKKNKNDDLDKTIDQFKAQIVADPGNHKAHYGLARVYFERGQLDKAIEAYIAAIKAKGDIAVYYADLSEAQYRLKQYTAAIANANKAIELDSSLVNPFFYRGNSYYEMGKYAEAEADFTSAIKLRPDFALYYNERGFARIQLGRFEPGIEDFNECVKKSPNAAIYYNNLGWAYSEWGKHAESIQPLEKALELDPNYKLAFGNLAWSRIQLKLYEKAITSPKNGLEAGITLYPEYTVLYYDLGLAHYHLNQFAKALPALDKAIQLNPEYAIAYKLRGKVHKEMGHHQKADEDYKKAVSLNPKLAERMVEGMK